ncbi:MAG: hypothetical protein VKP62_04360 [Candidatus Sericytochromatia bacterium]|nr:hypothetical protein [Candidatus Sericytochromatia bacterium]
MDSLDADNMGWTRAYVSGLSDRLAREQAVEAPDAGMVAYLEAELAAYQALLDQVTGGTASP